MTKDSIDRYLQLTKERPKIFEGDFLYIIKNPEELRQYQEEHGLTLGVVYQSPYHIMVVDLVKDSSGHIFPYERIIPTATQQGVVMIPQYQGKFVLLEQYRHAIREIQVCFPRGFGECDFDPQENARKELREELGADWLTLKFLGELTSDSGLTSGKTSVFVGEISSPSENLREEGIVTLHYLTESQLKQSIAENKIQDSFTLAALSLFWEGKDE